MRGRLGCLAYRGLGSERIDGCSCVSGYETLLYPAAGFGVERDGRVRGKKVYVWEIGGGGNCLFVFMNYTKDRI